ncbi:MAG: non-homologous end-joining DNA ligase [Candidatus Eremiobacteraeota bacterium]|nr:non-homologous end-joining DNA ligase [Candidatus Eremiobacteraeota bacterium]
MPQRKKTAAREAGSLKRYAAKRDFRATPEPAGRKGAGRSPRLRFVIQKHDATRLHYDFRLEADGVLKSWAIPKGPSLDPTDRRLAMHVEDHPLDYRDFEGIIPEGNYGAGEVIVWDKGTYRLAEGTDPAREIGQGKIKFVLHGQKMKGEFTLVRIRGRDESGDPWLLVKDKDEYVNPKYNIERDDKSVKSGKTLKDIAANRRAAKKWISSRKSAGEERKTRARPVRTDPMPKVAHPMLATLVDEAFDDPQWLFEVKWDGYRALCKVDDRGKLSLTSRNGLDFLKQFAELEDLGAAFASVPILVDGEIVSLDSKGRSSFQRLQGSFNRYRPSARGSSAQQYPLTFVAFDCLYADGKDLRSTPLEERKAILERLIADSSKVLLSKHVVERGCALFEQAQRQQLEGIIGKKRDSAYQERRSREWVKIKAQLVQECVIGGYTEPRGSRKGFGSLLLGLYERDQLQYAGHVGTGFDEKNLADIYKKLRSIEIKKSPFTGDVDSNTPAHWVKPQLVAQVRFTEWTRDGLMRHPAFLGLRVDKDPKTCTREVPLDTDRIA